MILNEDNIAAKRGALFHAKLTLHGSIGWASPWGINYQNYLNSISIRFSFTFEFDFHKKILMSQFHFKRKLLEIAGRRQQINCAMMDNFASQTIMDDFRNCSLTLLNKDTTGIEVVRYLLVVYLIISMIFKHRAICTENMHYFKYFIFVE